MSNPPTSPQTPAATGWRFLATVFVAALAGAIMSHVPSKLESHGHAAAASKTDQRRTEIVVAAEKVSPSIVTVGATNTSYMLNPYASFFNDFSVVPFQRKMPYVGSGVIVASDGLIVTNYHVIENAQDVFVTLTDGREIAAKVVGKEPTVDIAILKVDSKDLPAATLGKTSDLMVGEWVLALGNPFGNLIGDPRPSVTVGVVSALNRSFRAAGQNGRFFENMIQTDAAINPGNSGGALINASGELVGINTFIMSRSGGSEGIGFAIPVERVRALIDEIQKHGRVRNPLIDFRLQDMTPGLARVLGTSTVRGAVIAEIVKDGTAWKGGLRPGDVVMEINTRKINSATELAAFLLSQTVGTEVSMTVERASKTEKVRFTLREEQQLQ